MQLPNNKPQTASEFLAPSGWIKAAQKAHKAFKFAIVVAGLAAIVAIVLRFGPSPATLVFGVVIVVVLMVLFLVFAQAARLKRHVLTTESLFLVRAFLVLSVATAAFLFTSAFFDTPLPLRQYIVHSLNVAAQTKPPQNNPPDRLAELFYTTALAVGSRPSAPTPSEVAQLWPPEIAPRKEDDRGRFFQVQANLWDEYRQLASLPRVRSFGVPMTTIVSERTRYIYTPTFFEAHTAAGVRLPPPSVSMSVDIDSDGLCKGVAMQGAY